MRKYRISWKYCTAFAALLLLFVFAQGKSYVYAEEIPEVEEEVQTEYETEAEQDVPETPKAPDNVKKIKAKILSETSVKLTWKAVKGADKYQVYMYNVKTGEKKIKKTPATSLKVKKLVPGVKVKFKVKAIRNGVPSEKYSPAVSVKPAVKKPGKVKSVRIYKYLNKGLIIRWNSAANAKKYSVYYRKKGTDEFELAGTTKKLNYTLSGLKAGTWYEICVRAERTVSGVTRKGKVSEAISAMPEKIILANVHGRRFNVTMRQTATVQLYGSSKKITIQAGTRMLAWQGGGSLITCDVTTDTTQKKDYKVVRVPIRYLKYGTVATTPDWYVYTKQQKELFINQHFYSSQTSWLIWVNQYTSNCSIFRGSAGKWTMVRSSICVVGKYGGTGVGTEKILFRVPYLYGDVGVYFTWNAQKQIGNAFHQRVDSHSRGAWSKGCVRLGKEDLYFIYNNVPIGTTVVLS